MGCLKRYESLSYCCITLQYHNSILHHKLSCQGYWFYKYEISRIIQPASAQSDQNKSTDIPHPEICKRLMTPGENTVPTKLHTDVMTKWNYCWSLPKSFSVVHLIKLSRHIYSDWLIQRFSWGNLSSRCLT